MEELMLLIFLYILPAILTTFVMYQHEKEVFVKDLIKMFLLSMIPVVNLFGGYLAGFLLLVESERINKFLNKKIK